MNGRAAPVVYELGPFRVIPTDRLLLRDGERPVTPKVYDLLVAFLRGRGRALAKTELLETVWPGTFVEEGSLTRTVSLLREVLGDAGRGWIETVSKHGYRFTAAVREEIVPASKSIAVLPFTHLGDAEARYLGVGLADAVIARLAPIHQLMVRPTSAVLRYADQTSDAAKAAAELDVDLVLEGTVRTAGDRIRVSAQLVAGGSGSASWSGRFEATLHDLFAIEDALAKQIVDALSVQLSSGEQQRLTQRDTVDPDAYRLYLEGRYFWNKRSAEAVGKAIDYFQQAIDRDPRYAAAYSGLADCHLLASATDPAAATRARTAAQKALEIDPLLAEAHASLARIEMPLEWNWTAAEERLARAIELNPDYTTARQWRANLLAATGRTTEALAEIERARASDPLSPALLTAAGWIHYMARQSSEAIARYREALEIDPAFAHARRQLGMAYEQAGMFEKAIRTLRECENDSLALALLAHACAAAGDTRTARETIDKLTPIAAQQVLLLQIVAATHLQLGDRARALEFLRRAYDAHASTLMWLNVDPWFDALRDDREFRDILRAVGFGSARAA